MLSLTSLKLSMSIMNSTPELPGLASRRAMRISSSGRDLVVKPGHGVGAALIKEPELFALLPVDVAQRAELGFKEDGLALLLRVSQETAGVGDVGLDGAAVGVDPRHELVHRVALCAVDLLEHQVLPLKKVGKVLL